MEEEVEEIEEEVVEISSDSEQEVHISDDSFSIDEQLQAVSS